eukprot:UN00411
MDKFPISTQQDLVLTESVDWSNNAKQIIENDEKDFETNDLLINKSLNESLFCGMNINANKNDNINDKNHLAMSWGNYFAKKSPPMGDLCGSHGPGIEARPQFDRNHDNKPTLSEKAETNNGNEAEIKEEEIINNNAHLLEEELENEDMVIINEGLLDKSSENINFNEFNAHYLSNRDSNDTLKSSQSTDSQKLNKLIQIPKLKYIQRFYQFAIKKNELQSNNDQNIEQQIELIILQYLKSYTNDTERKAYLSAITYKAEHSTCTVVIL